MVPLSHGSVLTGSQGLSGDSVVQRAEKEHVKNIALL